MLKTDLEKLILREMKECPALHIPEDDKHYKLKCKSQYNGVLMQLDYDNILRVESQINYINEGKLHRNFMFKAAAGVGYFAVVGPLYMGFGYLTQNVALGMAALVPVAWGAWELFYREPRVSASLLTKLQKSKSKKRHRERQSEYEELKRQLNSPL